MNKNNEQFKIAFLVLAPLQNHVIHPLDYYYCNHEYLEKNPPFNTVKFWKELECKLEEKETN